jgi:hypothetical protein
MSPSPSHSAAGQALGYVHQVQWALVELVRRSATAPDIQLRIETLDDIEIIDSDGSSEYTQVKHQVTPTSDLTENSVDLWRSVNVWIDAFGDRAASEMPVLKLVTTATIPSGGKLNTLRRDEGRDIEAALGLLEEAARNSANQTSRSWREKFLALKSADRFALLNAISIDDASPRAREVGTALREVLHPVLPKGHKEAFIDYLLGWWNNISIRLLDRSIAAITAGDLDARISDLRDQFLPDNLPVDLELIVPFTVEDSAFYRNHQFVQQLVWIALDEPRLWRAIRDYHRAWAQRSEWLRLNLVSEPELEKFAFKLHDEWDYVFHERLAKMQRDGGPNAETVGQEILERLCADSKARIRDRLDEPWLNRGTLHALAHGWSGRTIGWHPDFASKLEQLLANVVT